MIKETLCNPNFKKAASPETHTKHFTNPSNLNGISIIKPQHKNLRKPTFRNIPNITAHNLHLKIRIFERVTFMKSYFHCKNKILSLL